MPCCKYFITISLTIQTPKNALSLSNANFHIFRTKSRNQCWPRQSKTVIGLKDTLNGKEKNTLNGKEKNSSIYYSSINIWKLVSFISHCSLIKLLNTCNYTATKRSWLLTAKLLGASKSSSTSLSIKIPNYPKKKTYFNSRHAISEESTSILHMSNVVCITQAAAAARTKTIPSNK